MDRRRHERITQIPRVDHVKTTHGNRATEAGLDTTSDPRFVDYYDRHSESEATLARFAAMREAALRVWDRYVGGKRDGLDVLDVGCGAGTQSLLWARAGHRVHGLDINEALVALARERAGKASIDIDYRVGSATALPWSRGSMDLCLAPELLEHVPDWERCLDEFARILRTGGLLVISTNNKLCPIQYEFDLPLYSWYPAPMKRYCERLAVTTHPQIANYARYPAVNWFTFYGLRAAFAQRGLRAVDRFDAQSPEGLRGPKRWMLGLIRSVQPVRWLANAATPYTLIFGIKGPVPGGK